MSGLPPLNQLRFLEAAVRLRSFRRAADELNVTPSAVSHAIETIERWYGGPLFVRAARGLEPGPEAQDFASCIRDALQTLHDATARVPGRRAQGHLSISAAPSFASRWLLPRLRRFSARHPDIRVQLDSTRHRIETDLAGIDLAIRRADQPAGSQTWLRLVREEIVPVCSPAFLMQAGTSDYRRVIGNGPHICLSSVADEWSEWTGRTISEDRRTSTIIEVDTIALAIEAAAAGLGVAIGRKPLVNVELEGERLVALAKPRAADSSYWLVGSDRIFDRPEARLFRQWLVDELRALPTDREP
ncbi:LysR substrate-binding domain-containing protein [Pseudorhodoplanes sp.]|uniref:LysR substrate-binding domain-containing protein n=1 Tax=Pseudorhodoplanes sp. TaxID=1934341 RepID=UPI00391D0C35